MSKSIMLINHYRCLAARCQELCVDEMDGIQTDPGAAAADLKAISILEYWSALLLQVPDAHEEYKEVFLDDLGPS